MSEEDIDIIIEIRKYFQFELFSGILENGGASNFKTEDAINTLTKILKIYKANLIEFKEEV